MIDRSPAHADRRRPCQFDELGKPRCDARGTHHLVAPNGDVVGTYCLGHGKPIVSSYRTRLGEEWTLHPVTIKVDVWPTPMPDLTSGPNAKCDIEECRHYGTFQADPKYRPTIRAFSECGVYLNNGAALLAFAMDLEQGLEWAKSCALELLIGQCGPDFTPEVEQKLRAAALRHPTLSEV
ncbi:MAG: hypothetical protein ACF8XB_09095 [Planctomycetota bacterium JB042]